MNPSTILVVEDDRPTRMVLEGRLRGAGYTVESVASGEQALAHLATRHVDLLVVDLQLPQISGLTVIEVAKAHDPELEAIVLTASTDLEEALRSLRCGVFDYLIKPGQPGELEITVARALARRRERLAQMQLVRRLGSELMRIAETAAPYLTGSPAPAEPPLAEHVLQVGDLQIDTRRHRVTCNARTIALSSTEFAVLAHLATYREQVCAPQQIVQAVFGYSCDTLDARNLVKLHIHKLRQKLAIDPGAPRLLVSVRGVGYMLSAGRA